MGYTSFIIKVLINQGCLKLLYDTAEVILCLLLFSMTKVTFQNKVGPFTETLKARINSYFENHKLDLTGNRQLYIKTAVLMTLLFSNYFILVFFTPPVWIAIILCAIMGMNFAAIGFNVMHDGAHGSYSSKKGLNAVMAYSLNLMGGSSYIWKIKHNLIQ